MLSPHDLFALLSDDTRLRCLLLLQKEKELCVCELNHIIGGMQPKISRHLALMRQSGLVLDERKGQWVYYQLNPHLEKWVKEILSTTFDNLKKSEPFCSDLKKLEGLRKRPSSRCN